jgi:hypothetical protein
MTFRTHGSQTLAAAACAVASLLAAARATAAEADAATPSPQEEQALGNHQRNVRLDIGARTQFVNSAGFDAFSEKDALGQLALSASFAFWTQEQLSVAAVAGFDYGGSSANLRSEEASLDLFRFTLAPEARYHVLRVLALTAKVGPTLTREVAKVSDSLGTTLLKTGWKFGFDATAGVAVEVWGYKSGKSHKPRLWLTGEGGYGWTAPMSLSMRPRDAAAVPQRYTPLELGELSVAGPLFRLTAGVSFW